MSTFYFGLRKNINLAEVVNSTESLSNLGVDIKDLDIIRGIKAGGLTTTDLKSLSGLNFDAEKVTNSLNAEMAIYESLLYKIFDKFSSVETNIKLNGALAAGAFKYNFVNFDAAGGPAVQGAEVSTSRVSSWSTLDSPVTDATPIFYGGNVNVEGPIELSNLIVEGQVSPRKYSAEIPTHRINMNIDGQNMFVYAMRGIPLVFQGYFSYANFYANVTTFGNNLNIKPTWLVKDTLTSSTAPITEFIDVANNAAIVFSRSNITDRTIELYYPPSNIVGLSLPSINLTQLPKAVLSNLKTLDISSNDFREFPNLSQYTNLENLYIQNNNLTRSTNNSLRTFSDNIVSRLPPNLKILSMGHTFAGAVTANLAPLPLTTLDMTGVGAYGRLFTGVTPTVNSSTIQSFKTHFNTFTQINDTLLNASNLKTAQFLATSLNQSNVYFTSPVLENVEINDVYSSNFKVNLINVENKTALKTYRFTNILVNQDNPTYPNNIKTIFNGCTTLTDIDISDTDVAGEFPDFIECSQLRRINFVRCSVSGADATTANLYAFKKDTFNFCRSVLNTLYLLTNNTTSAGIENGAFAGMNALVNLMINTSKRGLPSALPTTLFNQCPELRTIYYTKNLTVGAAPTFPSSTKVGYINLSDNEFTGSTPSLTNKPSLRTLLLNNNRFDSIGTLTLPSLRTLDISNNRLAGAIPNFSSLTNLTDLDLSTNLLEGYTRGSFSNLRLLRTLNLNSNRLTPGAVDQILRDLNDNYNASPRTGVSINIRGPLNSAPSNSREILDIITKLRSFWTLSLKI